MHTYCVQNNMLMLILRFKRMLKTTSIRKQRGREVARDVLDQDIKNWLQTLKIGHHVRTIAHANFIGSVLTTR